MVDFSARQHGDGMKSPAAEGLGRALEAAGAGHPEKTQMCIRDSRSAVTGGTRVISDGIVIRITVEPGHTFLALSLIHI